LPLSFWQQEKASAEAKGWMVHTYEVLAHIDLLLLKLGNAETSQRAYLLTGMDEYLEPYQDALRDTPASNPSSNLNSNAAISPGKEAPKHEVTLGPGVADNTFRQHRSVTQELAYIRHLTADNPAQQSNLDEMDDVVRKLLDYDAATIQARKTQDAKTAVALDMHRGKELMDQARSMARIMESEESHLLTLRSETDEITTRQNKSMVLSASGYFTSQWCFPSGSTKPAKSELQRRCCATRGSWKRAKKS
jgi:CHASE3 domain sensor protein